MNSYKTNTLLIPYPGLKKTLKYLLDQSLISIDYCIDRFGTDNTIKDIWQIGKNNLTYVNDAYKIEQIQSVGTLFENNIHDIPGAGDCDCFTVYTIAMLLASNYPTKNIFIVLQGNKKDAPSHILTAYIDEKTGEKYYLDFTQPMFNTVRTYKFYDVINIKKFM
jgi:hypothetical protein